MKKSILLIGLLISYLSYSQGFLKTQGTEIVNDNGPVLLKSIGTGNWMIQEGYMMQSSSAKINTHTQFRKKLEIVIGEAHTKEFYNTWLANHFTKRDLDSMKSWGFNSLRVALHYKWFTVPIEEEIINSDGTFENTWLDKGFDMLDKLLSWCADNEMYLILDMHGAPGGQGKNASISDYDASKPSLWESEKNKKKFVELWVKLADRYKNSIWIGGFDLINETNWNFTDSNHENGCNCKNNDDLWDLHKRLIEGIRSVNKNHIVYISGNCWGNNYESFDIHPLKQCDDNMVITFHKYWNNNRDDSIAKWLEIRDQYNMPLWMSEAGENSNTWFSDCISLLEKNNIGWSWWPVKKSKYNNIFKVKTDQDYKDMINSWANNENSSKEHTFKTVMQYAENHKMENCDIGYDVIYAMIDQPGNNTTKPFKNHKWNQPILFADYDLGRNGYAYYDEESADYHTDSGERTKWNLGGYYRNDGVDIVNENGTPYVGWTKKGEWLQYTISVPESGLYNIEINTSTNNKSSLELEINNSKASKIVSIPVLNTEKIKTDVNDIYLNKGENTIKFYINSGKPKLFNFLIVKN